jgi:flagellar hook assembly protein FlgD
LRILDVQGRSLRTLVDERQSADRDYTVTWDGRDGAGQSLASGSYLVELAIDGKSQSRFVTLLK